MANLGALGAGLTLLMVFGRLTCAAGDFPSAASVCLLKSVKESILGTPDLTCPSNKIDSLYFSGVIEGDEVALQRALNMVHKRMHDYVAVLFYASWCPFSGTFRPSFSTLASLFPSIPHFAIEESAIRPSILSKYGVHGFPTLFLLNSTMRVRYHGSRTMESLTTFYGDITGIQKALAEGTEHLDNNGCLSNHEKHNNDEQESCPFSWARSPENLLGRETYLALATAFVLLRLLYISFPALCRASHLEWRRHILNMRLRNLWEHPLVFIHRAVQLFKSLEEPCKRSNLQEGALNAKAWASKSLATVSFGRDASSSSRPVPVSENH